MSIDAISSHSSEAGINQNHFLLEQISLVLAARKQWDQQDKQGKPLTNELDMTTLEAALEHIVDTKPTLLGWKLSHNEKVESHTSVSTLVFESEFNPLESIRIIFEKDVKDAERYYSYQVDHIGGENIIEGFRIGFFPDLNEYRIAARINKDVEGYTFTKEGENIVDPGGRTPTTTRQDLLAHMRINLQRWGVDYPLIGSWSVKQSEWGMENLRSELQEVRNAKGNTYEEIMNNIVHPDRLEMII